MQYRQPNKKLVRGYVQLVAHYAGHADTLQELEDQYLRYEAEKRAGNISAVKSFEAFRSWVTIEAGFIPNTRCLMALLAKNPNHIVRKNGRCRVFPAV